MSAEEESEISSFLLSQVPLFAGCSEQVLSSLVRYMFAREVARAERIVKKGDTASEMFFIIKGRVSVVAGDGTVISDLSSGAFFGEMGLLYSIPRTASVHALTACRLYVLRKEDFDEVCQSHTEIREKIRQIAQRRFEWFKNHLRENLTDPKKFTEEQVSNFRQVFCDVDTDGSGAIDIDELGKLLFRLSGKEFSRIEMENMMKKMDEDRNGTIEFEEFIQGLKHLKWLVGDDDDGGSGSPTIRSLQQQQQQLYEQQNASFIERHRMLIIGILVVAIAILAWFFL